jgi:adenosylcobinamide kinase/adenosylcobinamide-phosphate guanylyltransferase
MSRIILVTGGARSGKSSFAQSLFEKESDVVYIATYRMYDDDLEMKERITLHKKSRPSKWKTFEGSYGLDEAVHGYKNYILDCLTVMTSNIMFDISKDVEVISQEMQNQIDQKVFNEIKKLIDEVINIDGNLVMVTNEVGCSIVPENHVARVYRDIMGRINQRTAKMCDEAFIVSCGIPLKIK